MHEILSWPPIVWVVRVVALGALLGSGWVGFLYLLRYFSKENIKALASGRLPRIRALQLFGQKFELQSVRRQELEELLLSLDDRLSEGEEKYHELSEGYKGTPRENG